MLSLIAITAPDKHEANYIFIAIRVKLDRGVYICCFVREGLYLMLGADSADGSQASDEP